MQNLENDKRVDSANKLIQVYVLYVILQQRETFFQIFKCFWFFFYFLWDFNKTISNATFSIVGMIYTLKSIQSTINSLKVDFKLRTTKQ